MPIDDILTEQTGVDPRVAQAQAQEQARSHAGSAGRALDPAIQIDRNDMQVILQLAQLLVLLMILRKL